MKKVTNEIKEMTELLIHLISKQYRGSTALAPLYRLLEDGEYDESQIDSLNFLRNQYESQLKDYYSGKLIKEFDNKQMVFKYDYDGGRDGDLFINENDEVFIMMDLKKIRLNNNLGT